MAPDAEANPRSSPPRASLPHSLRAGRRDAGRLHDRRPASALSVEDRHRRRDRRAEPQNAQPRRRCLPRRRCRRVRSLGRADLPHRLGRRTRARRPPHPALRPPPASVARLLRAQPYGRDREPHHERRRGARSARDRRHLEPGPEHARARGHRGRALPPRLAARSGDARRPSAHGACDGVVPVALEPRVPTCPRAPRARDGDARGGHLGHARRPVVHARARRARRRSAA